MDKSNKKLYQQNKIELIDKFIEIINYFLLISKTSFHTKYT